MSNELSLRLADTKNECQKMKSAAIKKTGVKADERSNFFIRQ